MRTDENSEAVAGMTLGPVPLKAVTSTTPGRVAVGRYSRRHGCERGRDSQGSDLHCVGCSP